METDREVHDMETEFATGGETPPGNRQLASQKFSAGRNFLNGSYHMLLLEYKKKPDSHLIQQMLVTHEGPTATLSREQLVDVVYVWYRKKERRIQLPDPVAVNAGLRCTSGPTS